MVFDRAEVKKIFADSPDRIDWLQLASDRISVFDKMKFTDLSDDGKCELAKFFILNCCPSIGGFISNGEPPFFLRQVAAELTKWPKGDGIAVRRLEHVAFAISNIADPYAGFASPPSALASTYLLHQLEFLFRALSSFLTLEGEFINSEAKNIVEQKLNRRFRKSRINNIEDTYSIMLLNTTFLAPELFKEIDTLLSPITLWNGTVIKNIGERIGALRHVVAHGPLADPSSEGFFYALVMTIILYGSNLFPRA